LTTWYYLVYYCVVYKHKLNKMSEVPTTLPCSPLGAPSQAEGTYLNYWPQQLAADPDLKSAAILAQFAIEGSHFVKAPDNLYSSGYVETWDRKLGSFNPMAEAAGDLLYGATYILQVNGRGRIGARSVRKQTSIPAITDAFLFMADRLGDLETQAPTHSLLIAGEMVCKAAWATDDFSLRDDLMHVGGQIFARIHQGDGPATKETIDAGVRWTDVQLYELSPTIRQACRKGEDVRPYQQRVAQLLYDQAGDLLRIPHIPDYRQARGGMGGHMFDHLGLNIVRRAILLHSDIQSNFPEARAAYTSEDRPLEPDERKVESKFDIVLLTKDTWGNVLSTEPWQLKLGEGAYQRSIPYHPAIKMISTNGLSVAAMKDAAHALRSICKKGEYDSHFAPVDQVADIFEPYVAPAKAA
jgi:hypothetical protein